jgi:hypothetical protein
MKMTILCGALLFSGLVAAGGGVALIEESAIVTAYASETAEGGVAYASGTATGAQRFAEDIAPTDTPPVANLVQLADSLVGMGIAVKMDAEAAAYGAANCAGAAATSYGHQLYVPADVGYEAGLLLSSGADTCVTEPGYGAVWSALAMASQKQAAVMFLLHGLVEL